jgi:WD40 repeat protein
MLLTGSSDKSIKLWLVNDGFNYKTFNVHSDIVTSVKFWIDNTKFASSSCDFSIKILNINTENVDLSMSSHSSCVIKIFIR